VDALTKEADIMHKQREKAEKQSAATIPQTKIVDFDL
jgi:hypothetical protein